MIAQPVSPFRNTLWLSAGDMLAKILNFLAIVYLARTLGVARYGVFEFGITILTYFALLADGGLEVWSTREVSKGANLAGLTARVLLIRLPLAVLAYVLLLICLPFLPAYSGLSEFLRIFGLVLIAQAFSLKWVFIGKEKMLLVGSGLLLTQLFFLLAIVRLVKTAEQLQLVGLIWLASEIVASLYFGWLYLARYGKPDIRLATGSLREIARPAITIGATQVMGLMNYNFDGLLLGFMAGAEQVGWYRAAYKPITAAIGIPLTYFAGLFPAMSRLYVQNQSNFQDLFQRSLRLTAIFAFPVGVAGTFLAEPVIHLLYGSEYLLSIPVMQILSWSATLVILRGTIRHGLIAAGQQNFAFRAAIIAVGTNILLNIILIPVLGMLGAAITTVISELVWLALIINFFDHNIFNLRWFSSIRLVVLAAIVMAVVLILLEDLYWPARLLFSVIIYLGVLAMVGEKEVRSWIDLFSIKKK